MPGINDRIQFNNRTYDVNPAGNTGSNSISKNFSELLKKSSEDKNISFEDLQQLKALHDGETKTNGSENKAETEIILALSGAGTALLNSNMSYTTEPVQITFGTPKPKTNTTSNTPTLAPTPANTNSETKSAAPNATPATYHVSIPSSSPEFTGNFNISEGLNTYFNNSVASGRPPKISYSEFEQLQAIAQKSSNPDDLKFVQNLANLAITKIDDRNKSDRKINITGADGKPIAIEIDTKPPTAKSTGGANKVTLKGFLQNIANVVGASAENTLGQAAINLYNSIHPNSPFITPVRPFTIAPVPPIGFSFSRGAGIGNDNRFHVNAGIQYTAPILGNNSFSLQANYATSVFTVPGFLNSPSSSNQPANGINLTVSLNIGNNARLSYNNRTGFEAAANINVGRDHFFEIGYNQGAHHSGGVTFGFGVKL